MPEGPELHLASKFVNLVCKGRIFTGKVVKSAVSTRQVEVEWNKPAYTIKASSRGKEMKLSLQCVKTKDQKPNSKYNVDGDSLDIVFQFGMSGKFDFYEASELKKHAHLNFFTNDDPKMVLSYVDYRRFGSWKPGGDWSKERGPCVIFEYDRFRENVVNNINDSAFNKPICETLLNQKYFNGIGNYLRAEILYRAGIPPFVSARSVLETLADSKQDDKSQVKVKQEGPDVLQLCNILPLEVVNLGGTGYDPEGRDPDYSKFSEWLQCYYNPNMKNMADHNKRTIWFAGNAGPMVPKEQKTKRMKTTSKVYKNKVQKNEQDQANKSEETGNKSDKAAKKLTRTKVKDEVVKDELPKEKVTRGRKKKAIKEENETEQPGNKTERSGKKKEQTGNKTKQPRKKKEQPVKKAAQPGKKNTINSNCVKKEVLDDCKIGNVNSDVKLKTGRKRRVANDVMLNTLVDGVESGVYQNASELVKRRKRNYNRLNGDVTVNDKVQVEPVCNDESEREVINMKPRRAEKTAKTKQLKGSKSQRRKSTT